MPYDILDEVPEQGAKGSLSRGLVVWPAAQRQQSPRPRHLTPHRPICLSTFPPGFFPRVSLSTNHNQQKKIRKEGLPFTLHTPGPSPPAFPELPEGGGRQQRSGPAAGAQAVLPNLGQWPWHCLSALRLLPFPPPLILGLLLLPSGLCVPFQTCPSIQGGKYLPKWERQQSTRNQVPQVLENETDTNLSPMRPLSLGHTG